MSRNRLCRWAGWGRGADALRLDDRPRLKTYLAETLGGLHEPPDEPVAPESLELPPSRLSESARAALVEKLGGEHVSLDDRQRLVHSLGRSYCDLVRARAGKVDAVADAVVYPGNETDVAAVLEIGASHSVAVVPFGGGTSVVGGIDPLRGAHEAVVVVDTSRLHRIRIDECSHLAEIGAGAFGPEIEEALGAAGFTLGHFPQSFEFSTLGGWVATRGAGQQSTRYGKIEDMVQAVRIVTPQGTIETRNVPAAASGPSVREQIVGSEGTLGVITSAVVRIRPISSAVRFAAFLLPDFEPGCQLFRRLEQAELPLSVARLSDAEETRWTSRAATGDPSLAARLGKSLIERAMRRRGFDPARTCFALLSLEGDAAEVKLAARKARRLAARIGAVSIGASPGRSWERERFRLPYLRDELLARRLMVDTLETATTWTNLTPLYDAVRQTLDEAMRSAGPPGVVMGHLSHLYKSGSSLYFTFIARQAEGREIEQWRTVKQAAMKAIVEGGGTLSHHHGIGRDHMPLSAEHGEIAVRALTAAKVALDPAGIMNPGKLLGE